MKKLWQVVSKKDLIFGLVVFALAILISLKPSNKIRVQFDESSVDITTTKYSMNIPYDMVDCIFLVDKPELGTQIDGYTDNIVAYGIWQNDVWQEYTACLEVATDNCIEIHLTDGRIFVISRRDNEETRLVFEEFQTYLQ